MRDPEARRNAARAFAVLGALIMVGSQFATVVSVDVASGSCASLSDTAPTLAERCVQSGIERHGAVFPLLGVAILVMSLGAARSRPAAAAVMVFGALGLAVALFSDLPASREAGVIGRDFAGAEARAGPGLYLEVAGAAIAVVAGAVALLPGPRRRGGQTAG